VFFADYPSDRALCNSQSDAFRRRALNVPQPASFPAYICRQAISYLSFFGIMQGSHFLLSEMYFLLSQVQMFFIAIIYDGWLKVLQKMTFKETFSANAQGCLAFMADCSCMHA
jgi:hypothetical protein